MATRLSSEMDRSRPAAEDQIHSPSADDRQSLPLIDKQLIEINVAKRKGDSHSAVVASLFSKQNEVSELTLATSML